jgi:transcriptional regulator with XRE-family HTH domain
MDMIDLGVRIKNRRKEIGMTQSFLAEANSMSRATISNLENGRLPEIGIRKVMSLCATLRLEFELREASARPTLRQLVKEKNHA